jgi:hypothetical protein
MKVTTDIHSGALAETAAQAVENVTGQVTEFVTAAQDQAQAVTGMAAGVFTGFWDAVRGVFR